MISYFLILLIATILPLTIYSSLALLILLLTLMSFSISHYQPFFSVYPILAWDSLSFSLSALTILISILIFLASVSNNNIIKFKSSFIFISMILLQLLIYTFSVTNLILFYILFEASLIPIFIIILGWGNQPERLQAGIYMLIYTVLSSLPLLISFILWSNFINRTRIFLLTLTKNSSLLAYLFAFTLIMAFSVKLPIYILHLWLPKAHVEAPVAGSIILAAILLKLGGYGILRISRISHNIICLIRPWIIRWSLVGGVIIAFTCLYQTDIKFLIALSSVVHISLVVARALTFSNWGINRAQIIIIGHGFCSSGLFCIANIIYERINSRSLLLLKGLATFIPSFYVIWFIICTSNIAAPPSLNLLGEITGISAVYSWSTILIRILILLVFLSAAYSLFLFRQTQHGKPSSNVKAIDPPSLREWLLLLFHWLPLNLFFLAPWVLQIIV